MKYRMLIADDEKKIIQLILQLVHWQELGIEVIATCCDGVEALEKIKQLKPDIVLTDIKMPVVDGIQLIERAKKEGLNIHFIVLSGYRHFEYAKSAIQLGVVDYLLKPLDEEQINSTLEKTCRKIDSMRAMEVQKEQLNSYLETDRKHALEDFWNHILAQDTEHEEFKNKDTCNAVFQTEFSFDQFRVLYLATNIDSLLREQESLFNEKIEETCRKIFLPETCGYLLKSDCHGIYLILNFEKAKREEVKRFIEAFFYRIKDLTDIYGEFMLHIGMSNSGNSPSELGELAKEAEIAHWGKMFFLGNRIISYDEIANLPRFEVQSVLTEDLEKDLDKAFTAFDFETIGVIFREIEKNSYNGQNGFPGDMKRVFEKLSQILRERELVSEEELYYCCSNARKFPQLIREIYKLTDQQLHKKYEELKKKAGRPIEGAKEYIKQHYAEQITMELLAEQAGLSPAYFSRLFKAETGVGCLEYLTQVRSNEAKELLAHSNLSMKEIAYEIGYLDDKYFLKIFKKTIGIKPKEYRQLYAK